MDTRKFEGIENYIYIKDQTLVEKNVEHVEMINNTLVFHADFSGTVQVVHELTSNKVEIGYDFEDNCHLNLIEVHSTKEPCTLNRTFNFRDYANVAIFTLNDCDAALVIKDHGSLSEGAEIECAYVELSITDVEADLTYDLNAEGAKIYVRNAVLSSMQKKKHLAVTFNHNAKNTYGQMDNYGVVKDESTLYFDGIGRIRRGNSGSATHQTSKIMVFDPNCKAEANPYLYIDEYDVAASHAAAVGKMDEEHLFYLQSRGLSRNQSMKLITYGYLMPCVDVIDNEAVKEAFANILEERMGD